MRTIMLLLILLVPSICNAEWTAQDTVLEAVYQTVNFLDYKQTMDIASKPDRFYERNRMLGEHPSKGKVNSYFAGMAAGHALISYVLPKKYRTVWQGVTIGIGGIYVINNFNIGTQVRF